MKHAIDYETLSTQKKPANWLAVALLVSVVEHVLVFLFIPSLDGNRQLLQSLMVSAGFWGVVILIVIRHRHKPSFVDVAFVMVGYPLMLAFCLYIDSL